MMNTQLIVDYINTHRTEFPDDKVLIDAVDKEFPEFFGGFKTCMNQFHAVANIDKALGFSGSKGFYREAYSFPSEGELVDEDEYVLEHGTTRVRRFYAVSCGLYTFGLDMKVCFRDKDGKEIPEEEEDLIKWERDDIEWDAPTTDEWDTPEEILDLWKECPPSPLIE